MIQQVNTNFVSYDLVLSRLDHIMTFATRLESTTGVLVYGHDVFFARIMPEGNFDRLHENFQATLLYGVIAFLVGGLVIAQKYVENKEKRETYLQN